MTNGTLAPLVSVHNLPVITPEGVVSLVELRFRSPDDFSEDGWTQTSFLVNAATAKVIAGQFENFDDAQIEVNEHREANRVTA